MMWKAGLRGLGLVLVTMLASSVSLAAGSVTSTGSGMYKWTDDQGSVHYSDHMPPEMVNKGSVVLDKQGRAIKKIDAATPPPDRAAKQAEEERAQALAKAQEEQARKDRALLQSFTSEDEIDLARNRAMSTIDAQLKSAESYSASLARRQQELENTKREYGTKPIPAAFERELTGIEDELARQNKLIGQKKEELSTVVARYDAEKHRWQELKAQGYAIPSPPPTDKMRGTGSPASPAPAKAAPGSPTAAR